MAVVPTCTISRLVFKAIIFGLAAFFFPKLNEVPKGTPPHAIKDRYDFAIVGAGGAGVVAAKILSAHFKVLILDSGSSETAESKTPLLWSTLLNTSQTSNYFTTKQHSSCRNTHGICEYFQANGFGGYSTISDLVAYRPNKEDFKEWGHEWTYSKVLPFLKMLETVLIPEYKSSPLRGTNGPLKIDFSLIKSPITDMLISGGEKLGLKNRDYNGKHQISVARPQLIVDGASRYSVTSAFFRGTSLPNVDVVYEAETEKVLINHHKVADGVRFKVGGTVREVKATHGVLLTSNPIVTTAILLRSGVGPYKHLKSLGIKVKADLPVGENFQDQVVATVAWKLKGYSVPSPKDQSTVCNAIEFAVKKTGPLTSNGIPVILFINTKHPGRTDGAPDVLIKFIEGKGSHESQLIAEVILLKPVSKGNVKLRSSKPSDPPLINPGFQGDHRDLKAIADGMAFANNLIKTHYLKKYYPQLDKSFAPLCKHSKCDEDYFQCLAREYNKPLGRGVGTAKLGSEDNKSAVVGSHLSVHKVGKLYVGDRSVFPKLTSSDGFLTNLVTGWRAALFMKEDCSSSYDSK